MTTTPTPFFDPGFGDHILVGNNIVEKKAHEIVERIKDIDDSLEVLCVDPDQCVFSDAPFVLAEVRNTPDGPQVFKVFEFWELNDSVIERVMLADSQKHDILKIIDENNTKVREEIHAAYREKMEESKDLVSHIVDKRGSSYSFKNDKDELVTIYDDRPAEVK